MFVDGGAAVARRVGTNTIASRPFASDVHVRRHHSGVIRSTFVVDEKGKIAAAQYNIKATGHVAKLRRDLSV
jgi:peroxiredoxin